MTVQHPAACMSGASVKNVVGSGAMRSTSSPTEVISGRLGSPPPMQAKKASSWRHSTPLGIPVVPPV